MLDWQAKIVPMNKTPDSLAEQYERLRRHLSQLGLISRGSVQDRTARKGGGAGYQWTRKVAQKTISVSLTAEQFHKLKEAIHNYRQLHRQLHQMEKLSRQIIFETSPHPTRLKRISKKVLCTN